MKTILHKAATRGAVDFGWLQSKHTFSFGKYQNAERMNFGALRVLNDDFVAPSQGFGKHPHDNMEIISIPLSGDLEHKDSMGNTTIIKEGDVQIMSAGTGISHSEFNKNSDKSVAFLQIWIIPNKKQVTPRYDQISTRNIAKQNEFYQVVSPNKNEQGVWAHQDTWFHIGEFNTQGIFEYQIKKEGNGVYVFVLEGDLEVAENILGKRDGLGVWDTKSIAFKIQQNSKVLLIEVPMIF